MAEVGQTSRSSTQQKNILKLHTEMISELGGMFAAKQWNSICHKVKMMKYVSTMDMGDVHSMFGLCRALMRNGIIKHGEYSDLREILVTCDVEAGVIIDDYSERICREREGPSPAKQPRLGDPGQQQSTEVHPDLKPMIETAKARIKNEKEEKKFYPTKGFCDAKAKLLKNKVVVIKGNTGDGKTAIAVQLLHWLSEEQQAGQPLQLHKIKKLDLLSPNLKLITFIDDIFGENEVSKTDVGEWNKRVSHVKTCFLDAQTETNFLVITVRNEVFNELEERSKGTIFTEDNLIDLSSHTYKIAKEKEEILEMYKPENFSWTDEEKTQITTYAPNIGFPQCCQLFYNSKELQKERARFFENPFDFLNEALSRLQECSSLLYLFLNDGMIMVKDLDPNSKKVNEKLLKEAFNINLTKGENDRSTLTCEKKIGFVKESLEKLVGFLVVKEKYWFGEDVYRFNHNSVYVAVALLYGQATPIGFIQNCPSESLSYLTTSKTATNMIVISSDLYTEMCERLLREFEDIGEYDFYDDDDDDDTCIGSLDVWNDPVFGKRFVRLLNDRKVDKLDVLNKACHSGAEECALYLLSEGVKPNEDTAFSLVSRHWNDSNRQVCLLRKIVVYLNDEAKLDVLNGACYSGVEECVLYLLSEGVKPNKDTDLWSLVCRHWYDSNKQVCLLRKIVVYLNDETKLDVLNKACGSGAEECALYLLSEGVKPNKETDWWSLVSRHRYDSNSQVCLLRKIVVYLNDETKLDVLNIACGSGAEECALYLLSEGVKPNKDTALSLVSGHWNDSNRQVCILRKMVVYLNDETKLAVLNEACRGGAEECALYLLSEGVKPNNYTALALLSGYWYDGNKQVCLLRKIVVYLNDETKLDVLNEACDSGAEECVLYLLSEGVKPNKDTVFKVVRWSVKVLDKLLTYDITPTVRYEDNNNVLHEACLCGTKEMVTLLCNTYPHLVHDTNNKGQTPLYVAAEGGNCSVFQTVERYVLNSLYRVEDQQHQCESVDGRVIHRNCVCAQYMAQLLDGEGMTVLHGSCEGRWGLWWRSDVCLYLCQSYPTLTTAVSKDGKHCLHFIAGSWRSDVDMFTECEAYVKQYQESTGGHYDITTILDNKGESVLDKAKKRRTKNGPLLDYLIKEFGKQN